MYRGSKTRIQAGGVTLTQHQRTTISDDDYAALEGRDKDDVVVLMEWFVKDNQVESPRVEPTPPQGQSEFDQQEQESSSS